MLNGANLYLVTNFIIAISFASVFFAVAERSRSRAAARWIGLGFAVASLSALAELLVAYTPFVDVFAIFAFASVLAGLLLIRVGIGKIYGVPVRAVGLLSVFVVGIALDAAIFDLPRDSLAHALLYQLPFAVATMMSVVAIGLSPHRAVVDRCLLIVMSLTSFHFLLKAVLAVAVGAGLRANDYISSHYAIVSQSLTAVLMVMAGLTMLAVLVLQIMADERSNSEVDTLSSLFNRRGFEAHADQALAKAGHGSHSIILCDLDHFKQVNDTYGHYAGDSVIRSFGALLRATVPAGAVVGRLGGEEFCILLPRTSLEAAMMLAHAVRGSIAVQSIQGLPGNFRITVSLGVSAFSETQQMGSAMRLADAALYDAKAAGRDCVRHRSNTGFVSKVVG